MAEAINKIIAEEGVGSNKFTQILTYMFFIQAFFSGIAIGEITEGNFIAGLKHAVILMILALFAVTFLTA